MRVSQAISANNASAKPSRFSIVNTAETKFYPLAYVAKELGICRKTAYNLINQGKLRSAKIGSKRVVSKAAFAEYLADIGG